MDKYNNLLRDHIKHTAGFYGVMDDLIEKFSEENEFFYNLHVGLYDEEERVELFVNFVRATERTIDELIEPLNLDSGKKGLDVGCGYMFPAIRIANKYGCSIAGITISDIQREKGCRFISKNQLDDKVYAEVMDAHDMSFKSESFDFAYSLESLFHLDKHRALSEIFRVLKKGGRLAICDFYEQIECGQNEIQAFVEGGFYWNKMSLDEIANVLRDVGFHNLQLNDWSNRARPTYDVWADWVLNIKEKYSEHENYKKIPIEINQIFKEKMGYYMLVAEK